MAITVVQSSSVVNATAIGAGGTASVSLTGVSATNLLILLVAWEDDSNTLGYPANVSDGVNSWNHATTGGDVNGNLNSSIGASVYSAYNVASGNPTVTVTSNAGTGASDVDVSMILIELAGAATAAAYDSAGAATATGNGTTGPVTGTGGTLSNAGDIVFAVSSAAGFSGGLTLPSGWSNLGISASVYPSYGFVYLLPGSTSALSPTFGSYGSSAFWSFGMGAYKPQAAGTAYTITAAQGSFALTGEAAVLTFAQPSSGTLLANPGAFNLTGAQSQTQAMIYSTFATFALTGEAAALSTGNALSTLVANFATFSLTGEVAVLQGPSYTFPAFTGFFTLTGEVALAPAPAGLEYLPNFVGMEWLDASRAIYQGGFREIDPQVVKLKGLDKAMLRGFVVGQTPAANTLVKIGATVQLSVASDHMLSVSFEAI